MSLQVDKPYRGRFAPTPSGPLHMGSLLTALAAWLDARAAGGAFLLRIDDLDAPRCPPAAADTICRQLEAHGLSWDETPRYQSRHVVEYEAALAAIANQTYRCSCTRARLAQASLVGLDGPVYDGRCRDHPAAPGRAALRVRLGAGQVELPGLWGPNPSRDVARDIGDVVVRRADGQIAYQLACVIDEAAQGITHVIRGADLLGSSFQQAALRRLTGHPSPRYGHLPVVVDPRGRKLSKQNHAAPLESARATENLAQCLSWLGLTPPAGAGVNELLAWARAAWSAAIPAGRAQRAMTFTYNALQHSGTST